MKRTPYRLAGAIGLTAVVGIWIGCGEDIMRPTALTGTLEVSVATTGGDRDDDGYELTLDGDRYVPVNAGGTAVIPDVREGAHEVELGGVAANCTTDTTSAPNPRPVTITVDDTTQVAFEVHCVSTGVQITTQTSGADPDPDGYLVLVDGAPARVVAASGTSVITRLSAGSHTVALGGVADHCEAADPNPVSVTVAMGEVAPVSFNVSCVALTASVEVTATTTGVDLDANGYTVEVRDNGTRRPLSVNGSMTINGLAAGEHTLWLDDVAANCTVGGLNPRTVSVTTGDTTRDTARTTFEVTCVSTAAALEISAATSGAELDPDGYRAYVGENCDYGYYYYYCGRYSSHPLGVNGVVTIEPALIGEAWVELQDVARNCSVDGGTWGYATVASTDTARVAFSVTCVQTGNLQVNVTTTGIDPDLEYSLSVHGPSFDTTAVVAGNATLMISRLRPGDYDVNLDDVALNCDVAGPNPTTATVSSGGTAVVGFDVACASLGSLQLTAMTTGVDLDPDGYTYRLQGERFGRSGAIAANETVVITGVPGGDYDVTLDGVAPNCDVLTANPTTVSVPSGGTGAVGFDVTCAQPLELAVTVTASNGNTDLYRVKMNGTGLTRLTTHSARDAQPAWSPDGGRIAFASTRDGNSEIYVMNGDGSGLVRLTASGGEDADPTWSPDGTRIAFRSNRIGNSEIYVMNADGTNPIRLTNHTGFDSDPAWSPDGSKIAFASNREGSDGIYVMSADGSGVTRLTSDGLQPAWSPDGSRLVFSRLAWCYYGYCEYALHIMNADGSGVTPLNTLSSALGPAWSADGRWIAYAATRCSDYYCYSTYTVVEVVEVDGGRIAEVMQDASEPAFRP